MLLQLLPLRQMLPLLLPLLLPNVRTRLVFAAQPLVVAVLKTQHRWLLKEQASSLHYYIEEYYM